MSDLVKRLRDGVGMQVGDWPALIHEAADRIEALEARVAAADKLAEAAANVSRMRVSPATGGRLILEVDVTRMDQALAAYEATKEQSDG